MSIIVVGRGDLEYHLIVDRVGTILDVGIGTPNWFVGKKLYSILEILTNKGFEYRREVKLKKNNN